MLRRQSRARLIPLIHGAENNAEGSLFGLQIGQSLTHSVGVKILYRLKSVLFCSVHTSRVVESAKRYRRQTGAIQALFRRTYSHDVSSALASRQRDCRGEYAVILRAEFPKHARGAVGFRGRYKVRRIERRRI